MHSQAERNRDDGEQQQKRRPEEFLKDEYKFVDCFASRVNEVQVLQRLHPTYN